MKQIAHFFDEQGRVKALPTKHSAKLQVLEALAGKFDKDCSYTEKEVNEIVSCWHTFGDFYLLRRELIDAGFLARTSDCSKYWRTPKTTHIIAPEE